MVYLLWLKKCVIFLLLLRELFLQYISSQLSKFLTGNAYGLLYRYFVFFPLLPDVTHSEDAQGQMSQA